jgi:hypothetical protein
MNNYIALALSFVVAVLTTGGATVALYHIGEDQRQNKNHRRHLDMAELTVGSKVSLLGVTVLVLSMAGVAFYRVWVEGQISGLEELALLLAGLVALVMLISAGMVFWSAFRDGSPERDDMVYYSTLVQRYLRIKASHESKAEDLEREREILVRHASRATNGSRNGMTQVSVPDWNEGRPPQPNAGSS